MAWTPNAEILANISRAAASSTVGDNAVQLQLLETLSQCKTSIPDYPMYLCWILFDKTCTNPNVQTFAMTQLKNLIVDETYSFKTEYRQFCKKLCFDNLGNDNPKMQKAASILFGTFIQVDTLQNSWELFQMLVQVLSSQNRLAVEGGLRSLGIILNSSLKELTKEQRESIVGPLLPVLLTHASNSSDVVLQEQALMTIQIIFPYAPSSFYSNFSKIVQVLFAHRASPSPTVREAVLNIFSVAIQAATEKAAKSSEKPEKAEESREAKMVVETLQLGMRELITHVLEMMNDSTDAVRVAACDFWSTLVDNSALAALDTVKTRLGEIVAMVVNRLKLNVLDMAEESDALEEDAQQEDSETSIPSVMGREQMKGAGKTGLGSGIYGKSSSSSAVDDDDDDDDIFEDEDEDDDNPDRYEEDDILNRQQKGQWTARKSCIVALQSFAVTYGPLLSQPFIQILGLLFAISSTNSSSSSSSSSTSPSIPSVDPTVLSALLAPNEEPWLLAESAIVSVAIVCEYRPDILASMLPNIVNWIITLSTTATRPILRLRCCWALGCLAPWISGPHGKALYEAAKERERKRRAKREKMAKGLLPYDADDDEEDEDDGDDEAEGGSAAKKGIKVLVKTWDQRVRSEQNEAEVAMFAPDATFTDTTIKALIARLSDKNKKVQRVASFSLRQLTSCLEEHIQQYAGVILPSAFASLSVCSKYNIIFLINTIREIFVYTPEILASKESLSVTLKGTVDRLNVAVAKRQEKIAQHLVDFLDSVVQIADANIAPFAPQVVEVLFKYMGEIVNWMKESEQKREQALGPSSSSSSASASSSSTASSALGISPVAAATLRTPTQIEDDPIADPLVLPLECFDTVVTIGGAAALSAVNGELLRSVLVFCLQIKHRQVLAATCGLIGDIVRVNVALIQDALPTVLQVICAFFAAQAAPKESPSPSPSTAPPKMRPLHNALVNVVWCVSEIITALGESLAFDRRMLIQQLLFFFRYDCITTVDDEHPFVRATQKPSGLSSVPQVVMVPFTPHQSDTTTVALTNVAECLARIARISPEETALIVSQCSLPPRTDRSKIQPSSTATTLPSTAAGGAAVPMQPAPSPIRLWLQYLTHFTADTAADQALAFDGITQAILRCPMVFFSELSSVLRMYAQWKGKEVPAALRASVVNVLQMFKKKGEEQGVWNAFYTQKIEAKYRRKLKKFYGFE
ncbi:uncharacterized protein MONOS_6062 [Monocercomonoides exilis]|uniref:uncharacterized protein n=1 Tax=Monocercomonoides exilis TaxID=2049356 RepID=UPI00355A88F0|nr:hypothetical protein MONOS_6062 [Monocercomonoides exilis]|eukprot:MONOS_6062.1-p1 / transcript=MONOS_6062.1 / gene=MONOS_6062 / organism=Monocercomonoides_exilis_PA203 / gene_product=unspecified product / transcript_product=unspecified product / location=Mono_scaffold00186:13322-17292(-) / protein_length=1204 / sequence_SO=supercontig / SO=protein_coding / is_pseudo=false